MDSLPIDGTTPAERRAQVASLEASMHALPDEVKIECPVTHHFASGMYGREMFIPAGTCVVSKIHRHEHLSILLSGTLTIDTEQGQETLTGPYVFVSRVGAKNVGVALTDVRFLTLHLNLKDETDLVALEAEHIAPSFDDLALPTIDASLLEVSP